MTKKQFALTCSLLFVVILTGGSCSQSGGDVSESDRSMSARRSLDYLRQVMDEFHGERFYVYYDVDSPHNHFFYRSLFTSTTGVVLWDELHEDAVHEGATSIRFTFQYEDPITDYGSFIMQNGAWLEGEDDFRANFGDVEGAGEDLGGAVSVTFWARGEKGNEKIKFSIAGEGRDLDTGVPTMPYPDSSAQIFFRDSTPRDTDPTVISLTTTWQRYTLDVRGVPLHHVIRALAWETPASLDADEDGEVIFYLDTIYYQLDTTTTQERLDTTPRFLRSFTTRPQQSDPNPVVGNFDHLLRTVSFTYDNSLALLAFLADGSADGLRRAKLIGDAFVHAAHNDRALVNGELRSAYAAGRITLPNGWEPNGIAEEIRFAGFYNTALPVPAFEELFTTNISLGNTAWPMTALLALYLETHDAKYLDAARNLGEFILQFRDVTCTFDGFTGGVTSIDLAELETFHSVEHNIDIYAAFTLMSDITGEQIWLDNADHAKNFVFAMWTGAPLNCFYPGTEGGANISCNLNTTPDQIPLDVHPWAVLAIPDTLNAFPEVLQCPFLNHAVTCSVEDLPGFDFNSDRDGLWFEGTAHMALALELAGLDQDAELYRQTLNTAQATLPTYRSELTSTLVEPIGLVAACTDGVTTGFNFNLFERLHIGATAWNIFAQLGFNPYYQTPVSSADLLSPTK